MSRYVFLMEKTKHLWQQTSQQSRILTAQAMIGTDAAGGESPKASIHDAELAFWSIDTFPTQKSLCFVFLQKYSHSIFIGNILNIN